jgi:hypothetical protein
MYIRWVTRRHKSALSAHIVFHDAYLVESYRDERGTPRQRTICYLGNVRQIDGNVPHVESELFLLRALQTLHRTAAVVPIDIELILDDLRQHLPTLTPEAARNALAAQLHWFYQWWLHNGTSQPADEIRHIVWDLLGDLREHERAS